MPETSGSQPGQGPVAGLRRGRGRPARGCQAPLADGSPCRRPAVPGAAFCSWHGGRPDGYLHQVKTGGYARYLPQGLALLYQEIASQPDLLSTRADIALLTARVVEVVQSLPRGGLTTLLRDLSSAHQDAGAAAQALDGAIRRHDATAFRGALANLRQALSRMQASLTAAGGTSAAWQELTNLIDCKAKLQRQEWQRLAEMHALLSPQQVMSLILAIADSVKRHVSSEAERSLVVNDIRDFISQTQAELEAGF